MGPIDFYMKLFQRKTLFFQTEMNLIFIYLIIQGHAISPFATFGKIFFLDS